MALNPNLVTVGTIHGSTPIQADVSQGLGAIPVKVTLSTDYTLSYPPPPGWPTRPGYDGAAVSSIVGIIRSGTTFAFLKPEADALVTAGAGSYA